jgi:hypothetical protein
MENTRIVGRINHWKFVKEASAMVDDDEDHETSEQDNDCEECRSKERRENELNMMVLNGNQFLAECGEEEKFRVSKRILHYYYNNDNMLFKGLMVPRPKEQRWIVVDLHNEISHFGEGRILVEVTKHYFWHNCTKEMKDVVRLCKQC